MIGDYPFQNFVLLLLFFLLMWIDGKAMVRGGWFFYMNKVVALLAIFGSFVLTDFGLCSWFLLIFIFLYSAAACFWVRRYN